MAIWVSKGEEPYDEKVYTDKEFKAFCRPVLQLKHEVFLRFTTADKLMKFGATEKIWEKA